VKLVKPAPGVRSSRSFATASSQQLALATEIKLV
jgi:hypothetical protein